MNFDLKAIEKSVQASLEAHGEVGVTSESFSTATNMEITQVEADTDHETYARQIMRNVLSFMENVQLSTESFDPSQTLSSNGDAFFSHSRNFASEMVEDGEHLAQLCVSCGVPHDRVPSTAVAIANLVGTYTDNNDPSSLAAHMLGLNSTEVTEDAKNNFMATSSFVGDTFNTVAIEAFGEHSMDAKPALAVAIASVVDRSRNMVTDRVAHRIPTKSGVVKFRTQDDQVFRLDQYDVKSMSSDPVQARESSVTRFIDMQHNPELASAELKRVEPKVANDPSGKYLAADNQLLFGVRAPIMDLDLKGTNKERDHFNHTDFLSDAAFVESFTIEMNDGTNTVPLTIKAENVTGSHFRVGPSNHRSTDRVSNILHSHYIRRKTTDGNLIETAIPEGHYIELLITMDSHLNLETGETHSQLSMTFSARAIDGGAPHADLVALCNTLTNNSTGLHYTIDARWSETNLRKSDTVVRTYHREYQVAIPTGTNLLYDFDFTTSAPEDIMGLINTFIAIDRDEKNVRKAKFRIGEINDRMLAEKELGGIRHDRRYAQNYVVGHRIVPTAHFGSINLMSASEHWNSGVKTFRTSDVRSDIRSFVDMNFSQIFAKIYDTSLYDTAIAGRPHWKCITTNPVCDLCLGVKHIHDQYNRSGEGWSRNASGDLEKIMDDGTTITVITVPWNSMKNKAILIPYVKGSKDSNFSFWKNFDRGVFASQCRISQSAGQWKRIFANASEDTVITCPVGVVIDFADFDEAFTLLKDAATPDDLNP